MSRKKTDPSMDYIHRINGGWMVKVLDYNVLQSDGKPSVIYDYFLDSEHHGMEALSLDAAQRWRDEVVEEYGIVPPGDRKNARMVNRRNKTGVIGVRLTFSKSGEPLCWVASLKNESESYPINQTDYHDAWFRAVRARYRMMNVAPPEKLPPPKPWHELRACRSV